MARRVGHRHGPCRESQRWWREADEASSMPRLLTRGMEGVNDGTGARSLRIDVRQHARDRGGGGRRTLLAVRDGTHGGEPRADPNRGGRVVHRGRRADPRIRTDPSEDTTGCGDAVGGASRLTGWWNPRVARDGRTAPCRGARPSLSPPQP